MKLLLLTICLNALFLSDCQNSNSGNSASNQSQPVASATESTNKMASENVQSKRVGDLQYVIKTRLVKKGQRDGINYQNDVLYIDYEVKNLGDKNYLVFNQGHNDKDDRNVVYVEPQIDSSIELSQKAFVQPRDKNCPLYDAPILPRAAWLKAGQIIKNQVSVELPLKFKTPFAECSPQPEMPKELKTVRFCLGVSEADPKTVKVGKDNSFQDTEAVKKQQVLCSEFINLK